MRTPPLLDDFIHPRNCKPICENSLTLPALNSTVSECSDAVCGQTCGQRALLDQVRHNCHSLSRRALFHVQVWGIVPLPGLRCKVFFRSGVSIFSMPIQRIRPGGISPVIPRLSPTRSRHGGMDCRPEDPIASVEGPFHPSESRTGECLPEGCPHRRFEKVVEPDDHLP